MAVEAKGGDSTNVNGERDEEAEREIILATIELFVQKSIESLRSVKEEKEMLEQIAVMKEKGERDGSTVVELGGGARGRGRGRTDGPILAPDGKVCHCNWCLFKTIPSLLYWTIDH